VEIDVTGHVSTAQIVSPIHPRYDPLLLAAAKKWTYEPALSNGAPIPSERLVNVVLKAKRAATGIDRPLRSANKSHPLGEL
jgi:hypothetical protein